jgi:site-specific DNA recombinase
MRPMSVALYARVSSEQQAMARTIDSQVAAVRERIAADGLTISEELTFIDDGFSGATLVRPALERLRDSAAAGGITRLYVLAPDRLARKYAYQVLLLEELRRAGVQVIFLTQSPGTTPEDELLVQVQGMVAEYERAKILERARRGKRQGALAGSVAVIGHAPYGYRYVTKAEGGGQARYEVLLEEARVVREIFTWVGQEHVSMGEVGRRLTAAGVPRRTSADPWDRSLVYSLCKNPAYRGAAAFGKTTVGPLRPRVRTQRGHPDVARRPVSVYQMPPEEWLTIPVPALVSEELFAAVQEQLQHNRRHARLELRCTQFLVQGLAVCARCGCAYCGAIGGARCKGDPARRYGYYRCSGFDRTLRCGLPRCDNPATRGDLLDAAVWSEVERLLLEPERLLTEYERRLQDPALDHGASDVRALERQVQTLRRGIGRLIDSYAEGLIDKEQFEPRVRRLKERMALLEADAAKEAAALAEQQSLRLVIGQLDDFVATVKDRLSDLDWETRRAILRALVKRVEVDHTHIRVVFRVGPAPLILHPDGTVSQDRERSYRNPGYRPTCAPHAQYHPCCRRLRWSGSSRGRRNRFDRRRRGQAAQYRTG